MSRKQEQERVDEGGVRQIPVGPAGAPVAWATVDVADYEQVVVWRWYLSPGGYAFRTSAGRSFFMHREIADAPVGKVVHHKNKDGLDNRRANLEVTTQALHMAGHSERRRADLAEAYGDPIIALYRDLGSAEAVAARLGVSAAFVRDYVVDSFSYVELRFLQRKRADKATPLDAVADLRAGQSIFGDAPMPLLAYAEIAREHGLIGPQTISKLYGSWRAALSAAGLPQNRAGGPKPRFTADECEAAVASCADVLGRVPTSVEYDSHARANPGLPSLATVRNRCGSWRAAVEPFMEKAA